MKKFKKLLFLPFALIGGLLGSLGGTSGISKGVRRVGIPVIITIFAIYTLGNFWCISIMFMSFVLSLGYGIPCFIPGYEDEGSSLGKFYYKLALTMGQNLTKTQLYANIMTRSTVGLLICLSMLSVPLIKGNWVIYGMFTVIITLVFALVSWRSLGTFKAFKKELLISEFIPYALLVGLSQLLIMY